MYRLIKNLKKESNDSIDALKGKNLNKLQKIKGGISNLQNFLKEDTKEKKLFNVI